MHNIIFKNVSKSYGNKDVIKKLDFEIREGERVIFLGPSGCGKSTTLRMIAGLESITHGDLYLGGERVNDVAPGERNVAMVFQSYALFPHMNVWDNITFGLKIQKLPEAEIEKRAKEALAMLHLENFAAQPVRSLSGGQKQRVALCRAIVKHSPYFLLDEPLSNLDAQLRQRARQELVRIHELAHPTMVYVTHDQIEAMTVGQRIAVLHDGKLQQIAPPKEIYARPANTFVASFIGSPAMNLIPARRQGDILFFGGTSVRMPNDVLAPLGVREEMTLGIRPENLHLTGEGEANLLKGICQYAENTGNLQTLQVRLTNGNRIFTQTSENRTARKAGDNLAMSFRWEDICFFDKENGKLIV